MSIVQFPSGQRPIDRPAPSPDLRPARVALTVTIKASIATHRRRRHFDTDEAFDEYERERAIYLANEATVQWQYPVAVADWTARDVDNLIARVLETLASLTDPVNDKRLGSATQAGCVSVKFWRMGAGGDRHTQLWITSLRTHYLATITIPGSPIPATALLGMIERHGEVDVQLAMRARPGYFPVHAGSTSGAAPARAGVRTLTGAAPDGSRNPIR